jgi:hypothetical protein
MKLKGIKNHKEGRKQGRFSIMEVTVASGVVGVMFAALLSGLTSSVTNVQFGREQNRATQIMVEKLDTIRMYRWDKMNNTYIPSSFVERFTPSDTQQGENQETFVGPVYHGTVAIEDAGLTESYNQNLKQVTVTVHWLSGKRTVQRQMTTFVSRYGLQKYVP